MTGNVALLQTCCINFLAVLSVQDLLECDWQVSRANHKVQVRSVQSARCVEKRLRIRATRHP